MLKTVLHKVILDNLWKTVLENIKDLRGNTNVQKNYYNTLEDRTYSAERICDLFKIMQQLAWDYPSSVNALLDACGEITTGEEFNQVLNPNQWDT